MENVRQNLIDPMIKPYLVYDNHRAHMSKIAQKCIDEHYK